MGQRSGNRVGTVFAHDVRGIGHLVDTGRPQLYGKQLGFLLVVVAHPNLGVVADAVVHAGRGLKIVLIVNLTLDIVEAAGRVGVGVGRWIQLHQRLDVRVGEVARLWTPALA